MSHYVGLTLGQITDIFGGVYDLSKVNLYLQGYRQENQKYDVRVLDSEILLYYYPSTKYSLPVTGAILK